MRTIGKANKIHIKKLTAETGKAMGWTGDIHGSVIRRLQETKPEMFEIWEAAPAEIRREVLDLVMAAVHGGM